MPRPAIVVHGGAGRWATDPDTRRRALEAVRKAAHHGLEILLRGGLALDAVVEAIKVLENSEVLNAGIGSVLTIDGRIEMDAGLMDGCRGRGAGVGCVTYPKNPIVLAREVLERTDHVLLVGTAADRFAQSLGLEEHPGPLPQRIEKYRELLRSRNLGYWKKVLDVAKVMGLDIGGTVGAVALDLEGCIAAGASTGGVWLKLPGRIGDSAIVGAGFYADSRVGGVSATGLGETIVMNFVARRVVEKMLSGLGLLQACLEIVKEHTQRFGRGTLGFVALDVRGNYVAIHNTECMPFAYACRDKVVVSMEGLRIV